MGSKRDAIYILYNISVINIFLINVPDISRIVNHSSTPRGFRYVLVWQLLCI